MSIYVTISDGEDKIDFLSYTKGVTVAITFADLTIAQSVGDVKIDGLDAGDEILIRNEFTSNITADDFIL